MKKMKISDIIYALEEAFPPNYQESYDNSGLIIGDKNAETQSAILCLDVTSKVIDEAIEKGSKLVISHHPIIFQKIKRINLSSEQEKIIVKCIKNDIAVYAIHTNLDSSINGINQIIAKKIGLKNFKILQAIQNDLLKLVVYTPETHAGEVRNALFETGAGHIGNYDSCSFNTAGTGTFRGNDNTNPFVGNKNELHFEDEIRIETILPKHKLRKALTEVEKVHPYEEVAYDIYPLLNENPKVGMGIIGNLDNEILLGQLFDLMKESLKLNIIKHNALDLNKKIKRIAICSGSGAFVSDAAARQKADILITADLKYHDFLDFQKTLILADIGHFESEIWVQNLLLEFISKKFPKFAVLKSENSKNPVQYY
jgi:dinuclear metal center YbgI/SA1388 family protein